MWLTPFIKGWFDLPGIQIRNSSLIYNKIQRLEMKGRCVLTRNKLKFNYGGISHGRSTSDTEDYGEISISRNVKIRLTFSAPAFVEIDPSVSLQLCYTEYSNELYLFIHYAALCRFNGDSPVCCCWGPVSSGVQRQNYNWICQDQQFSNSDFEECLKIQIFKFQLEFAQQLWKIAFAEEPCLPIVPFSCWKDEVSFLQHSSSYCPLSCQGHVWEVSAVRAVPQVSDAMVELTCLLARKQLLSCSKKLRFGASGLYLKLFLCNPVWYCHYSPIERHSRRASCYQKMTLLRKLIFVYKLSNLIISASCPHIWEA